MSDEDEQQTALIEEENPPRPYVIRKVVKHTIESHGGSWKVAYADFATAMMAFFLLMWVIGATTKEEKQAISSYFNDPGGAIVGPGGADAAVIEMKAPTVLERGDKPLRPETIDSTDDEGIVKRGSLDEEDVVQLADFIERERLDKLKQNLEDEVNTSATFRHYRNQIFIDVVPDGLRIQLLDQENRAMFDSGSPMPKGHTQTVFFKLAKLINKVPNKISITGHTDAQPFVDRDDYSNWELSADRANAARRALIKGGLKAKAIAKVEGFGDSALHDKENPDNPINRRIAIIVLKRSALEAMDKNTQMLEHSP